MSASEKGLTTTSSGDTAVETHWFLLSPADTAQRLSTSTDDGLTSNEASSRLQRNGPNELSGGGGVSWWSILVGQICSTSSAPARIRGPS